MPMPGYGAQDTLIESKLSIAAGAPGAAIAGMPRPCGQMCPYLRALPGTVEDDCAIAG
jgi:hypothetical protein